MRGWRVAGVRESGGMEREHDGRGCEAEAEGCGAASEEGSVEDLDHIRAPTDELDGHPGCELLWEGESCGRPMFWCVRRVVRLWLGVSHACSLSSVACLTWW